MEYSIENEIKEKLENKDFEKWDKYSIIFLVSIFQFKQYNKLYEGNINLLKKYIEWARDNQDKVYGKNMYKYSTLVNIYHLINDDIFYNRNVDYKIELERKEKSYKYDEDDEYDFFLGSYGFICIGFIFIIIIIFIKFIKNTLVNTCIKPLNQPYKIYQYPKPIATPDTSFLNNIINKLSESYNESSPESPESHESPETIKDEPKIENLLKTILKNFSNINI